MPYAVSNPMVLHVDALSALSFDGVGSDAFRAFIVA
jgi:hypothetical protein